MPNYGHATFGLNLLHAYLKWTPCTIYSVKADRQPTVHCNLYQISTLASDYLVTRFKKLLAAIIFRQNVFLFESEAGKQPEGLRSSGSSKN